MRKCPICTEGQLEEQHIEKWLRSEGKWVLFRHVPALVCDQCGDTTFTSEVVERLHGVLVPTSGARPTELIYSKVYDLTEIDAAQATGRLPLAFETAPVMATTTEWPDSEPKRSGTVVEVLNRT